MNVANQKKINLSSENYAGVHGKMMSALAAANADNVPSYGNDHYTQSAIAVFKTHFGENIEVYFTFNGTGANNFGISAATGKHNSVFCTEVAHLNVDESTAPEAFTGCRIFPVKSADGKIILGDLKNKLNRAGDVHHPQPKVVTITQPTEYGTVYTIDELKALKQVCTENNLLLHIDGARFFNAAVHLNTSLKQLSADAGVDILTLGGTKSGMMFGEAVIFFNCPVPNANKFMLKRSMQLASKNRFIAAQFAAMLRDELWKEIANHANRLAAMLEKELAKIPSLEIAYPVETNAVFVKMPKHIFDELQKIATFYHWNEERNEYRFMISFNSTADEITRFVEQVKLLAGG